MEALVLSILRSKRPKLMLGPTGTATAIAKAIDIFTLSASNAVGFNAYGANGYVGAVPPLTARESSTAALLRTPSAILRLRRPTV